jgi:acylphosphatase
METYEIRVYGKVQGVGYRWYAKKIAGELGVFGQVKRLSKNKKLGSFLFFIIRRQF